MYLVQGLLGLSRLAVFTFLKDDLALTPASVALITSAGYAPWVRPPPASAVVQASLLLQRGKCVPWLSTALLATTARCTPGSLTSGSLPSGPALPAADDQACVWLPVGCRTAVWLPPLLLLGALWRARWVGGWMDGWMDGWMGGWVGGGLGDAGP